MSIPELSDAGTATVEQVTAEAEVQIGKVNQRAAGFLFGAQKLMLEELVFAGNEMMERAQTETHLFSEFTSKNGRRTFRQGHQDDVRGMRQASDRFYSPRLRPALQAWPADDRSRIEPVQEPSAELTGIPCP